MLCLKSTYSGSGGVAGGSGSSGAASQKASGTGSSSYGVPLILLTTGMTKTIQVTLSDDIYGDTPAVISEGSTAVFKAKETLYTSEYMYECPVTILNRDTATVSIAFTPEATSNYGTWIGSVQLRDSTEGKYGEYMCYVQVALGLDRPQGSRTSSVLTIPEVRMALMDTSPDANTLLNDLEFSDTQIMDAIQRPVQDFNDCPPMISTEFTASNFPWRGPWLTGTCAVLLRAAAVKYARNELPHSAGGFSADPNNKASIYLQQAELRWREWIGFRNAKKAELNMSDAWGTIGMGIYDTDWGDL